MTNTKKKVYIDSLKELMVEWDSEKNSNIGLDPQKITRGSHKKAYWVCKKDKKHNWVAEVGKRCRGRGCPYCSGQKVLYEESLKNKRKDLMREWDYQQNEKENIDPGEIPLGSGKKVFWKCRLHPEHRWKASVFQRTGKKGTKCPYCNGGSDVVKNQNSISFMRPDLLDIWDYKKNNQKGIYPDSIGISSRKEVSWKCKINSEHTWIKTMEHIRSGKNRCPHCKVEEDKEFSFGNLYNNSTIEWHPIKNKGSSYDFRFWSSQKAWFKCNQCKFSWQSVIGSIANGRGCPRCAIKVKTSKGEKRIEDYLIQNKINFKREVVLPECKSTRNLRFDFEIYLKHNKKVYIEYDGEQHFKPIDKFGGETTFKKTIERDKIKNI